MIPITKPLIGKKELKSVSRSILSGWVMQGQEVKSFEVEFAEYVKSIFACAVSSGTPALHLALRAVGVTEGDEVITPSHSLSSPRPTASGTAGESLHLSISTRTPST